MPLDPLIPLTSALVLSYVFVAAAVHKWTNPTGFRAILLNYQVMPHSLAGPLAYCIPVLELLCGIALLIPYTAAPAALLAGALLLLYMLVISINLLRGRHSIDCGCGGTDQKQVISVWLVVRNAVLAGISYLVIADTQARTLGWLDWIIALLAAVVGCLFYNIVNQLLVNTDLLKGLRSHHG